MKIEKIACSKNQNHKPKSFLPGPAEKPDFSSG